jgi:putative transposase
VTDEWTKEGLAIEVDGRIRSARVIEVLARLVSERGAPLYLRSDNGPEFARAAARDLAAKGSVVEHPREGPKIKHSTE